MTLSRIKQTIATLCISLLSCATLAEVPMVESIQVTLDALSLNEPSWVTYQVDIAPNSGTPCCFDGGDKVASCSLDKASSNNIGVNMNPLVSKKLNIYFTWGAGDSLDFFYVGDRCPVKTKGHKLIRLSGVSQTSSIDFLSQYLSAEDHQVVKDSLRGIALHKSERANSILSVIAGRDDSDIAKDAIFWLGATRNKFGYDYLQKIFRQQSRSNDILEQAVFALSQNNYAQASATLASMAKYHTNETVQAASLFWLSQNKLAGAEKIILHVIDGDFSDNLHHKALFALTQLNTGSSWKALVSIAKHHTNQQMREEAIFWLSQVGHDDAKAHLLAIINSDDALVFKDKAVFALSQLPAPHATQALVAVISSSTDKRVKKKALFWLGQSNDDSALDMIAKILNVEG